MRIIKSTIAVLICYLVNLWRGDAGMVFYSQLAALWCIQMYRSNTIKNAIQRTIGTVVGALYGLIYLLTFPIFSKTNTHHILLETILVPVCLLLVLYTTVLLDKKQTSYFSCVVFLSIAVNHVSDVVPYLFVWNRFLDTMIGIIIGIAINNVHICINPDRDTLFVSGLDDTLLDKDEMLSSFSKVELNRMIDSGMKFTVSTIRTPASLIEPMRDVRLKLPVIAMDGAALYDVKRNLYLHIYGISNEITNKLMNLISEDEICWYANSVVDEVLLIHYGETDDEINRNLVSSLKVSPLRNYIKRPLNSGETVVYFMLLDKTEKIEEFYLKLEEEDYFRELRINKYPSRDYPGYSYIKIYNKDATKDNMLKYLKDYLKVDRSITFGTIPGQYDVLINEDDANQVVRKVRKMYEPFIFRRKN